ncbi:MAG TPA: sialidase family protein, partial [Streptosporangiaceae bacterium]
PAGAAQPDGQPSGALLASEPSGLGLLCTGPAAGGRQHKTVYASADGGQTWRRAGRAPEPGTAWFLSGSPSGALLLATSRGIEVSADGGASWSAAGGAVPPGGFAYVGMTTATQGVAVPAGPAQHAIWFTYDGGSTWLPSPAGA